MHVLCKPLPRHFAPHAARLGGIVNFLAHGGELGAHAEIVDEAGDLLVPLAKGFISRDHLRGELADLVTGQVKGRTSNDEITVFKSVGYALEDAVTAHLAYLKAVRLGVGVSVDL